MSARILTLGEALTDIVIRPSSTPVELPGGSPMNVAVALGRLGHDSYLLTHIGDDARGQQIRTHVEESRVHLTEGSIVPGGTTSTAEATIGSDGAATYEFSLQWSPDAVGLPTNVTVAHFGSIGATVEPGAETVRDVIGALREHALISYDPNARPTLMGEADRAREIIERNMALADVVKASDEDLEWLYPGEESSTVAERLVREGVALAVVTRGGEGATAFTVEGRVDVPGRDVSVADTVGAGDTFSAGLIDALIRREITGARGRDDLRNLSLAHVTEILGHAARLAAVTVSRAGANPPWDHEVSA